MARKHLPAAGGIDAFLRAQSDRNLLRFITCGSVDDGKSTLIGRLLWESKQLCDDQIAALHSESKRFGTQGENIDFALLVDGLSAEREQGITIDVAYRFFATDRRRFSAADTPGHEQYTRNMVTAASNADCALLLVDARTGLLTQARRHAFIASLFGVRHVLLVVNKMDQVGFDVARFEAIREAFADFAAALGFASVGAIPVSALQGDNITRRSARTAWYHGPTLIGYLEGVDVHREADGRLVFPVQWVNRPHADFRGLAGTVAAGRVAPGDRVRVTASGQIAAVAEIVTMDGALAAAVAGDAVTLRLDREIDASRGDVIAAADEPLEMSDQFEATLVWMHDDAGLVGRSYELKLATQWCNAQLTTIKHRVDVNTLAHEPARQLVLNDIAVCNVACSQPLVCDAYARAPALGAFILADRYTHATVAAGMIRHSLRRARNVHRQALAVTRAERERLNGHAGRVIWFTGLSGSGKSTLANALEVELHRRGLRTYILDGDNVRQGLNRDLGFTDADRVENIRRVAEVARLMLDAGLVVMTAFISPFERERDMAREAIGAERFIEVYVDTPLAVCEQRDVKGLYRKARAGLIPNMTGLNSPYEVPRRPDFVADGARGEVAQVVAELAERVTAPMARG